METNINGTDYDFELDEDEITYDYYEDYKNRTSQVFLEKLVGQYPAEVKAGIRYLSAMFPPSRQKRYLQYICGTS